jgi:transcription elongation factor GreA
MAEELLLTREGYDKIVAEYEELVTVRRKEIAERIKEAISYGDISENSEYDSAKNEQADLEERINKLENMMRMAKIIDEEDIPDDRVRVGLTVKVKEVGTDEVLEFTIVGSTEADPFKGKISNASLVGAALLGKTVNEIAEVQVPDGVVSYQKIDIFR